VHTPLSPTVNPTFLFAPLQICSPKKKYSQVKKKYWGRGEICPYHVTPVTFPKCYSDCRFLPEKKKPNLNIRGCPN
jgi:hypothetical protein